jgi:hypothetical protein
MDAVDIVVARLDAYGLRTNGLSPDIPLAETAGRAGRVVEPHLRR